MASEYQAPSRMQQLRALKVDQCYSEARILKESTTAREAKEVANSMRLAIGSTFSALTKETGRSFERTTNITFNKRGDVTVVMIVQRTK